MNRFARIIAPVAVAATMGSVAAVGAVSAPSAFADGKATMGCSQPYTLAPIGSSTEPGSIVYFSQSLVQDGFFTEDSMLVLLNSLDHNGDRYLCYKTPPGWAGPSSTNAAHHAGFVNLVDDKVVN